MGSLEEFGFQGNGLYSCLGGEIDGQIGFLSKLDLKILGLHGFLEPMEHFGVHLAQIFHRVVVKQQ